VIRFRLRPKRCYTALVNVVEHETLQLIEKFALGFGLACILHVMRVNEFFVL
jgi:hypothetical protein